MVPYLLCGVDCRHFDEDVVHLHIKYKVFRELTFGRGRFLSLVMAIYFLKFWFVDTDAHGDKVNIAGHRKCFKSTIYRFT